MLEAPLEDQVTGAKRIQAQWRDVGPTPRGVDQRLWKEFRAVCDQIFANRSAEQVREREAQDQAFATLKHAIQQLEQAVEACTQGKSTASRQDMRGLDEPIEAALAGLPSRAPKTLMQQIDRARNAYQDLLEQQRHAAINEEVEQWQRWEAEVTAAEQGGQVGTAPHPVFEARLNGTAAEIDLIQLVLTAEIAADVPSETHQSERMAIQIDMMNQGQRGIDATWQTLVEQWCSAPKQPADSGPLNERFFRAIKQRVTMQA